MSHPFFIIELKADFSLDDCVDFLNAITAKGTRLFRQFYVALPFFRLKEIVAAFPDSGITFGTAMINDSDPGSFTQPIAAKMVKDAQGYFTLIGTAYERNRLNLTPEQLENKLNEAFKNHLKVVYAVGGGQDVDQETLVEQLNLLKNSKAIENDPHPTLIYELNFKKFQNYLPTAQELEEASAFIKNAVQTVFESASTSFAILAALPSDLIGFSELMESLPFDGAFFIKSGAYPHSVHDETVKLVHVHCEEENSNP